MATELPLRSGLDLQGISSLANLFLGKSTTQTNTGSRTSQESVSPDAVNAVVKSILEGNQGLAAVSSGQRTAGLYNSSTNQLLTNDLIARASAEGAKLNKTTTVTDNLKQNTNVGRQANPGKTAAVLAGLSLIPKDLKASMVSKLFGGIGIKGAGANTAADSYTDPTETDVQDAINRGSGSFDTSGATGSSDITGGSDTGVDAGANAGLDLSGITDLSADPSTIIDIPNTSGGGSDLVGSPDVSPDISGGDFGPEFDPGPDFSDFDLGLAKGGMVKASMQRPMIRHYAEGGIVRRDDSGSSLSERVARGFTNPAAEAAFSSGGDDKSVPNKSTQSQSSDSKSASNSNQSSDSGTGHKSLAIKIIDRIMGYDKAPGYAEGGPVNTGLRNMASTEIDPTRSSATNNDQNVGAVVSSLTGGLKKASSSSSSNRSVTSTDTAGANGAADASQATAVGDSATNASVAVGLGIGLASAAIGVPAAAVGMVANALGITNTSITGLAMSNIASALGITPDAMSVAVSQADKSNDAISQADDAAMTADPDAAVADAVGNTMGDMGVSVGIGDSDASSADSSSTGDSGDSGAGDSGGSSGDSGSSSGDSGGSGDSGSGDSGGDGGPGEKSGGHIDGEGTSTSDSIPIHVSDGEYVVNAAATQAFLPVLEHINNMGKAYMAKRNAGAGAGT